MKSKKLSILTIVASIFLSSQLLLPKQDQSFGKTHFIIGADVGDVKRSQKSRRLKRSLRVGDSFGPIAQVFFSPDDDTRGILLDLIACERGAIYIAAFLLTDEVIAHALIEAKERGVVVQVVTDRLCCRGRHGKIGLLYNQGVNVLVYCGRYRNNKNMSDIMHHKFIVFKKNLLGRSMLWTGSFNFTHSARLRNQENVLILDNTDLIDRYLKQFAVLKTRCMPYHKGLFKKKHERLAHKTTKGTPQALLHKNRSKLIIKHEARSKTS